MGTDSWKPFTIEDALAIRLPTERCPIRLSPDGRLLAYSTQGGARDELHERLWVTEVDLGRTREVAPEAQRAWGPAWSPAGDRLAFYADTGGGLQLWVWETDTGETLRVSSAQIVTRFHFEVPQWTPDGRTLLCSVSDRMPGSDGERDRDASEAQVSEHGARVRVWQSSGPDEPSSGALPDTIQEEMPCPALIDLSNGDARVLLEGVRQATCALSPDGRFLAALCCVGSDKPGGQYGTYELRVVELSTGGVRILDPRVVEDYAVSLSWSPDSTKIAYRPDHEVAVAGLDCERRLLTSFDRGIRDDFYEAPLWSADGSFVIVTNRGALWRIPLGGQPTDLTVDCGSLHVRGLVAPGGGPVVWSPDGRSAIVDVADLATREVGLARVDLVEGGLRDFSPEPGGFSGVARYDLDACPVRDLVTFISQSATRAPDVWATDSRFSSRRRLTDMNPHVIQGQFTEPQLLRWTDSDGEVRLSAFYPPPAHYGPPPHPVIFRVYEGDQSAFIDDFGRIIDYIGGIAPFTNHGFGLCLVDLRVSWEEPARSIRESLGRAVQALVAAGLAAPGRIGIYGHSYGGYVANVAITGLDCFAAAVTDTGTCDLISDYAGGPGRPFGWYYESGQGRMGAPPWEDPTRYVENSPLFAVDRATTPVLILHGSRDNSAFQAWEFFAALQRLGKPAQLVLYEDEGHAEWRRPTILDRWQRVLEWFDRYLMP